MDFGEKKMKKIDKGGKRRRKAGAKGQNDLKTIRAKTINGISMLLDTLKLAGVSRAKQCFLGNKFYTLYSSN